MSANAYLAALGYIAFLLLVSGISKVIKDNKKRKTRELLKRLNSSYFRSVTDVYYRAGKL
jgi:hypothetical protein